jgi:endo-1,4-beta-xylanase
MKKRFIAFLVMLIFVTSLLNPMYLPFLTTVAKAQSSQTNLKFDFESGIQGWTGRGTSTTVETVYKVAYEGEYSLKVSGRNSSWDGAVVDITPNISVNTTYTVSMFVYHNDAKPQRFSVYAYVKDSAGEKYIQIADKVVMPNYWKQIFGKLTITTSNPLQNVKLLVCVPSNKSLEFYVDSVIVTSAQPAQSGIVKSSTFESGSTEGWQARGTGSDAQISVVDTVAHSGSKSLYVTGRAQTWQGAQIDLTSLLEKGKEYQFSIWVYQNSGSDQNITLTMQRKNADNTTNYDTIKWQQTVPSGVWTEITGSYQVPQTATQLVFYVESPNATLSFYLDDFSAVDKNPPVVNPGLIKSCTFESGTTEDFVPRGSTVSLTVYDSVYYHSGKKALYVSGRTSTWHGAQMDLTSLLEKGKDYQFSIWVYQDSGSDQKITLTYGKNKYR